MNKRKSPCCTPTGMGTCISVPEFALLSRHPTLVIDTLADGEAEADGLIDADGLTELDGETEADGETDADGEPAVNIHPVFPDTLVECDPA
jgi:hypothetical protein